MVALVVGGCPSCVEQAVIDLRRVGLAENRDYYLMYVDELKEDPIFKAHPELGQFTSAFLYNRETGQAINLKNITLTQEARANIRKLALQNTL